MVFARIEDLLGQFIIRGEAKCALPGRARYVKIYWPISLIFSKLPRMVSFYAEIKHTF